MNLYPNANSSLATSVRKNVYASNYGCASNKFDFEIILNQLNKAGFKVTKNIESADIFLINTCGVKKQTEDRILEQLRNLDKIGKPLIITGCLPRIHLKSIMKAAPNFSSILDVQSIDKIPLAIKLATQGEKRIIYSKKSLMKINLPRTRLNPVIEIITNSEGCNGNCTFCCVRFSRGTLFSYAKKDIIRNLEIAISEGAKEIWLTGQNSGDYGRDRGTDLVNLLEECCLVKGKFMIRLGMINPDSIIPILNRLIQVFKNEKIFKFLHIPLQSGDNIVLRRMNRKYSVEQFKMIVRAFRKEIPSITLSTDIICGYPGESGKAFDNTLELVKEIRPDIINISKFFPRPKTPAARLHQLEPSEIKKRSKILTQVSKRISLEKNANLIGWKGEILVDEKGKNISWIGRNFLYKPIVVKSERNLLGEYLDVVVIKVFSTYLEGKQTNATKKSAR